MRTILDEVFLSQLDEEYTKNFGEHALNKFTHQIKCKCPKCCFKSKGQNLKTFNETILDEVLFEANAFKLPVVHLIKKSLVSKNDDKHRGSQLNDPGQPQIRNPEYCHLSSSQSLLNIVDWLDVENSKRYKAGNGDTFCNVYASDYCMFAGAYLPRVWWTTKAIQKLKKGENVEIKYGDTVHELDANSLFKWFSDFGSQFYWQEMKPNGHDFTEIQETANNGNVVTLVYKNPSGKSGHLLVVIPESGKRLAKRVNGVVTLPVHSQAGAVNFSYNDHDPQSPYNKTSLFQAVVQGSSNVKIYRNPINCSS